jgi:hypothetical protein
MRFEIKKLYKSGDKYEVPVFESVEEVIAYVNANPEKALKAFNSKLHYDATVIAIQKREQRLAKQEGWDKIDTSHD